LKNMCLRVTIREVGSLFWGKVLMEFRKNLSKRECQVLELVSSGSSNAQIADQLGITQSTAKTHLRNIYSKTDFHNRTNLAINYLSAKD